MPKDTHEYFAVDSDVLHDLVCFDYLVKKNNGSDKINPDEVEDDYVRKNLNYLRSLYNMIKNDEIRILIVPTVLHECEHSDSCCAFMKKYCYMQIVNETNEKDLAKQADELAAAYCENYVYKGQVYSAPMMKQYSAAQHKFVPSNDAYIMAEATIAGAAAVITRNARHFIKDVRNEDDDNSRAKGIMTINRMKGYSKALKREDGKVIHVCTAPKTINSLMPILRDKKGLNQRFFIKSHSDEMSKISERVKSGKLTLRGRKKTKLPKGGDDYSKPPQRR